MSILNNEATVRHDQVAAPDYDGNDSIFEVDHLSLAYPGGRGYPAVEILNNVSFSVERGHALTLVGPSGSGKSSVLRCLNRLVEPPSGQARVKLCIRPAGVPGDFSENRLAATLDEVGLDPKLLDREAATLSGGEKQR